MSKAALRVLAATCDVPESRFTSLSRLPGDQLDTLDRVLKQALLREDARVDTGLTDALRMIPRPLRGRARALLFPEGPDA